MMSDHRTLHTQLKDVTRRYGQAMERYEQGMQRGDVARADEALADMQAIESRVTIIERPAR